MRRRSPEGSALAVEGEGSKRGYGHAVEARRRLSTAAMRGVSLYEPAELVLTAAAGTPLREIGGLLDQQGQQLAFEPADYGLILGGPADRGTIGGAIAINASGPRRIKAGAARDHVLGFRAVSGRGEPFKSGGRVMKNVTGYDLSKLMAGSHGTLGVMSEITVKVLPKPETEETVVFAALDDAAAVAADDRGFGPAGGSLRLRPSAGRGRTDGAQAGGAGGFRRLPARGAAQAFRRRGRGAARGRLAGLLGGSARCAPAGGQGRATLAALGGAGRRRGDRGAARRARTADCGPAL